MVIWQGAGIFALLIPALLVVLGQSGVDAVFGSGYSKLHAWPLAMLLVLSAVAVWLLAQRLAKVPGKLLIDPTTNQQVELKKKHTIFWLPMQWAAVVIAVGGVAMLFR